MNKDIPEEVRIETKTVKVTKVETIKLESVYCPNCGKKLHKVYSRCRYCGQRLKKIKSEV